MSDKNDNGKDQNKQDAEKKYSIDEENKYGAHGTEEDVSSNFSGQDSEHDNTDQKENKNIEQDNKVDSGNFNQENNDFITYEQNQSQKHEQVNQEDADETNTNISETLTNQDEQNLTNNEPSVETLTNQDEKNLTSNEPSVETLTDQNRPNLTSDGVPVESDITTHSNENMLTSSDNIVQKPTSNTMSTRVGYSKNTKTSSSKSSVRTSNLRANTNITTKSSSEQSTTKSKFASKVLGWGKAVTSLFKRDKDKSEVANVLSNTTDLMVNNPYTNKIVNRVKEKIGISFLKKFEIGEEKIKKLAAEKAQSLIEGGAKQLAPQQLRNLIDEAAEEVAKGIMDKFSTANMVVNAASKFGKGQLVEAGAEPLQAVSLKELWLLATANLPTTMLVAATIALIIISIGFFQTISHSTSDNKLRNDMNLTNNYAYNYVKKDDYSEDQIQGNSNNTNDLIIDLYDEHVAIQNQNKTYKWLNDYFLNVNSPSHPKGINNIKTISKDILSEFAKKIIVAKQKKYQINDDVFVNYFYEVALGDLFEQDIKVRKQILFDYIVGELGDRDKIIIDVETLEAEVDKKFNDYIGIMADFIKDNQTDSEPIDIININQENGNENESNTKELDDKQKKQIISEFKKTISDDESIDIEYYEKIMDNSATEIKFENENKLGSQNDIYELMYFLYFVDKIQIDYLDDNYVLDINKYQSLIENIYNETSKLNLNLVWDSNSGIENELNFTFSDKKKKDTSASMELTDVLKLTYKKIYDDLKKRITSMDEEVENIEYNSSSLFEIWAIFNNELRYLEQENIDTNLLTGNSKLANSYKAMVHKTLNFIKEMKKYTDKFSWYDSIWENNLGQLRNYLNQIAKGDKNKSQVKNITRDIFNHLNKLKDMAYATGWNQSGSKDTKKVFDRYVGSKIPKYVDYYNGNSLFRDLYIFKQRLKNLSDVKITSDIMKQNNNDSENVPILADVWNAFKIQLSSVSNSYSDQYVFGTCYEEFPNNITNYFGEAIKEIESGEKLGNEIEKIVDEKIISGLNNLIEALGTGLELNNQKFDEKKNIMYENINQKDEEDESKDFEDEDNKIEDINKSTDIEIYENIDLNDLKISDDETRFKKININLNGTEEAYFLFDDIAQIKNIKSVFVMNNFGKWFSDSDFYNMFFVDEDYGFDLNKKNKEIQEENIISNSIDETGTENSTETEDENKKTNENVEQFINEAINKLVNKYESDSYYADFKDSMLQLSQIYDSMLTHDSEKVIDFGYALKEKKDSNKNNDYIDSEYYDFMEIKNLKPGENIYSICEGFVGAINRDKNKLIIKYCDLKDKKYSAEEDDKDKDKDKDDDNKDEEEDDDEDLDDYIDEYKKSVGEFGYNQDLYIVYEGLNINSNLFIGQEIIRNYNGMEIEQKDFESKKSTVIGTALGDNLKIYSFLVSDNKIDKKEFINPFLICNIHEPFEPEKVKTPSESPSSSSSDSESDNRTSVNKYYKDGDESEFKNVSPRVPHRTLLKVFGEIIHVAGMIYAIWAIIKFSLGLHDYESVNYQAIWQFFAASILIFGGILLKYMSGLK